MFEIAWSEILVIAVIAIVVFPSKDLPRLLRNVGRMVGKARRMAGDFQTQFNAALREAEREVDLEDARKHITDLREANPLTDVRKALDPIRNAAEDLKRDLRGAASVPMASPKPPAGTVAVPNAPVKTGAAGETAAEAAAPSAAESAPPPPPAAPTVKVDVPAPAAAPPAGTAPIPVQPTTSAEGGPR